MKVAFLHDLSVGHGILDIREIHDKTYITLKEKHKENPYYLYKDVYENSISVGLEKLDDFIHLKSHLKDMRTLQDLFR